MSNSKCKAQIALHVLAASWREEWLGGEWPLEEDEIVMFLLQLEVNVLLLKEGSEMFCFQVCYSGVGNVYMLHSGLDWNVVVCRVMLTECSFSGFWTMMTDV